MLFASCCRQDGTGFNQVSLTVSLWAEQERNPDRRVSKTGQYPGLLHPISSQRRISLLCLCVWGWSMSLLTQWSQLVQPLRRLQGLFLFDWRVCDTVGFTCPPIRSSSASGVGLQSVVWTHWTRAKLKSLNTHQRVSVTAGSDAGTVLLQSD